MSKKTKIVFDSLDPQVTPDILEKEEKGDPYSLATETPLVKGILESLNRAGGNDKAKPIAFEEDPTATARYAGVYYDKLGLMPDRLLKRVSMTDDLVGNILTIRGNQAAPFGRILEDRFSYGFRIELVDKPRLKSLPEAERAAFVKKIKKAQTIMFNCGKTSGWNKEERTILPTFLRVSARNGLLFGRIATEVLYTYRDGKKEFHSFRARDSGTIYRALPKVDSADHIRKQAIQRLAELKNEKVDPRKYAQDEYTWFQVINGTPVQGFGPEEMLVHNFFPCTDIELNGYPITPIDNALAAITTHINITSHNKLYFQNGRAAKGMLVIQSDSVDTTTISDLRQQFQATINSVSNSWRTPVFKVGKEDDIQWRAIDQGGRDMEFQFLYDSNCRVVMATFQISPDEIPAYSHLCLHPDTNIWTKTGLTTIGNILEDKKEQSGFQIWTGQKWSEARAFLTEKKEVRKTITSNNTSVTSSPEHLFRIVDDSGELAWKKQKELNIGDTVLINRNPVPGFKANIPKYNGSSLTEDMMEVLGWLTGDGSISVRKKGLLKHCKELFFYYHHDKEINIRDRHIDILRSFGLAPIKTDKTISLASIERQKERCGFKTVSSIKRQINLYDTEFVNWLLEIGFSSSSEGKVIPEFIHSLPINYRGAFLKGFFSADGSKDKLDTPSITICNENLREQTKLLLLNMGIRTRFCEGTVKNAFIKDIATGNYKREYTKEKSRLIIKDKLEFFDRIGFLQEHKQPIDLNKIKNGIQRWDKVAKSIAINLSDKLISRKDISRFDKEEIINALKDQKYPYVVKSNLLKYSNKYKEAVPGWINDFYQEQIVCLETQEETIDMVDIEVFDNDHAFMANGMVVHNSKGTTSQSLSEENGEYKLEAARDVGIRPMLINLQDFLSFQILPLIDAEVAEHCVVKFYGLESESPEKERTAIKESMGLWGTIDDINHKVEKETFGKRWGGEFPLNPEYQAVLDKYFTVGEVKEHFFGIEGASKDKAWAYCRDPFYFQNLQLVMQQEQMAEQQKMAQEQLKQQDSQGKQEQSQGKPKEGQPQDQKNSANKTNDLESDIDKVLHSM